MSNDDYEQEEAAKVESDLLTTKEAAAYLRCSREFLQSDRRTSKFGIPYIQFCGRVRYRKSALDEFLNDRTVI